MKIPSEEVKFLRGQAVISFTNLELAALILLVNTDDYCPLNIHNQVSYVTSQN